MEAPKSSHPPFSVTVEDGKAYCKCEEGWTCVITKTEPSKAGKGYCVCSGSSCTCSTMDEAAVKQVSDPQQAVESSTGSKVYCKCVEGWTCKITQTEGPQAGKTIIECGEACVCVIDDTNAVTVACNC